LRAPRKLRPAKRIKSSEVNANFLVSDLSLHVLATYSGADGRQQKHLFCIPVSLSFCIDTVCTVCSRNFKNLQTRQFSYRRHEESIFASPLIGVGLSTAYF
jgi:hypothetical protein